MSDLDTTPAALASALKGLKRRTATAQCLAAGASVVAAIALFGDVDALRGPLGWTLATAAEVEHPPASAAPEAPRVPEVVEANRFLLRDHAGRLRAQLGLDRDDSVSLVLFDLQEK